MEFWKRSLENLVMNSSFWEGKRVLVTGHTGFKGGWVALWLSSLGAEVTGFALPPPTVPNLFTVARVGEGICSITGDVRDLDSVIGVVQQSQPDVVLHMAAQSLVGPSYLDPVETYMTNVMGTIHMIEAVRRHGGVRVFISITSDKCYENKEWIWGYRETDPMGGRDPYSSSKGCAELVTAAYRSSFFGASSLLSTRVASARAGNVIGGGDWSADRLIPDAVRAFSNGRKLEVRSPGAVRPWQHVLEPLSGYLTLAERLWTDASFIGGWNFGPQDGDARTVAEVVELMCSHWGQDARWADVSEGNHFHEAGLLKLDCSKARSRLEWKAVWSLEQCLDATVAWYRAHLTGEDMQLFSLQQIRDYTAAQVRAGQYAWSSQMCEAS